MILARTGVEPTPDSDDETRHCLLDMYKQIPNWELFAGRYATISYDIYQAAVVERNVEPVYLLIRDCQRLAAWGG